MKTKLVVLLLLTTPVFAHHYHVPTPWPIVSAKDARQEISDIAYKAHAEAIDWWIQYINSRVLTESHNQNATVTIDVTVASMEVQCYLAGEYEREGYHSELIPGWTGYDEHHRGGHPDGKTYLGLSW